MQDKRYVPLSCAITEGVAKINDRKVHSFKREVFAGDAILIVKAGTTGYKGEVCLKDSCRTFVCLESIFGDIHFKSITDPVGRMTGFEIVGCGQP
jgi:hypothetical protein